MQLIQFITLCLCITVASATTEADNGGWNPEDGGVRACTEPSKSRCNFEIITDCSITEEQFRERYWNTPVIIRGCSNNTPVQKRSFTKSEILSKYGKVEFPVGDAESLYLGKTHPRPWKMTMEQYVQLMDANHTQKYHPHLYMFEWFENLNSEAQNILKSFIPTKIFSETLGGDENERVLAIGAHGAGVPFHFHGPAWNELIYGVKRWFMYPITVSPGGGYNELFDQSHWYDRNYNSLKLEEMPYECVQYPGDIVFVPEAFNHATINCGQSVGVAALVPDTNAGQARHNMNDQGVTYLLANSVSAQMAGNMAESVTLMKKAYRAASENDFISYMMAIKYLEIRDLDHAIPLLKRSLRLNPLRVATYRDLARARMGDGRPARALKALELAITHCPEYPTETCLDIYRMLEDMYQKKDMKHVAANVKQKINTMMARFGRVPREGTQTYPKELLNIVLEDAQSKTTK
jgi:hypothetical protein